ncbi:hypothetical protein D210916BOD24_20960 [Alteromonas sp. D210916BOD_24]|uniref:hypothetical protein n=1 Tax=Alteromonas sp. D210916BOD_24 TaxID=3157618 RepID=UPI00399CA51C
MSEIEKIRVERTYTPLAYAIYYFFSFASRIPNSQNNKYAELTAALQGLFMIMPTMGYFLIKPARIAWFFAPQKRHL